VDKPKLSVVSRTPEPDTPAAKVRKGLRKTRTVSIPQCPHCEGRTFLWVQTGSTKQRACVFCLMTENRIVVMT
jgi:hypothetical protein